jgi:eukaryotic-like serine/threonine-protein kinase
VETPKHCPRCGGLLSKAGPLGGACPRCMIELGAETEPGAWAVSDIAPTPSVVGRYRILRLIGEGGMGAVYEAEQEHPRRIIALKVIKPGIISAELLRRFEQESQALGRLQHPGIAQIYDAGTADTGLGPQPYFAMELIRGTTLGDYAQERHLNTRQRLEIVSKIAEAVQHAHQRGLIHRDLKPANIMVDETGQPKILDFGVARASDSDSLATTQTNMGQLLGTLAYMSPEQVLADPLELDTRSDVYALGVILYELLAGRLPYAISKKLHETIQAIREEDPARLSSIDSTYGGDIETIAAKALEKDKNRRYGSAADLAADIQRYLHDEPILARPPSAGYQLRKFARRHKALVGGTVAVLLVLVAGVAVSMWLAVRAGRAEAAALAQKDRALASESLVRRERDRAITEQKRADTEAATSRAVIEFLGNDLWAMVDPRTQATRASTPTDPDLTVRKALDLAVPRIAGRFEKQPLVEARLRETIASAYQSLRVLEPAEEQLELAVRLRTVHQGEDHPDTLTSMQRLADVYILMGQVPNGEELHKKAIEKARRTLGDEDPTTQALVSRLVGFYTNNMPAKGETFLAPLVRDQRLKLGDDSPVTLTNMGRLIDLYSLRPLQPQKYVEAETMLKGVIGRGHGTAANALAKLYIIQNRYKEAEELLRSRKTDATSLDLLSDLYVKQGKLDAAAALVKKRGDATSSVANLADLYEKQGNPKKAEELLFERLNTQRRTLGDADLATMASMSALGDSYSMHGEFEKAEQTFTELWKIQTKALGGNYPDTRFTLGKLAQLFVDDGRDAQSRGETEKAQQRYSRGEELLNQLLQLSLSVSADQEQASSRQVRHRLAQMFVGQGRFDKAEEQFEAMQAIQRSIPSGVETPMFRVITSQLAWTRLHQGKYALAEQDLRIVSVNPKSDNFYLYNWKNILGASLVGQKRFAEAEPHLLDAYAGTRRKPEPAAGANFGLARFTLEESGQWIVRLYQDWGKPEKVAEWRARTQVDTAASSARGFAQQERN